MKVRHPPGLLKPFFPTARSADQIARAGSHHPKAAMMHITKLTLADLGTSIRGVGVRQIRLACGLVLFNYLLSHFINHALGNISMEALATGVRYHTAFWKSLPVASGVLYRSDHPCRARDLGALPAP